MPKLAEKPQTEAVNSAIKSSQSRPVLTGALKLQQARHYLGGLSVPTMHRLIQRGLLRPNKSTRHLLFPISELDRFLHEGMAE